MSDSSDWDFPKIITLDTPIVERLRTRAESWAEGWELDALTDKEAADEIERLRTNLHLIAQIHQEEHVDGYGVVCIDCDQDWPCSTYQLINSKEPDDE